MKAIPVRDQNGDQLTLYELRDREWPWRLFARKRLVLCTGEPVRAAGKGRFVVAATGERLKPV